VKVSDKLLCLNESPAGITKSIVEITGIEEKDGRVYADTRTLFPPWYEGGTGFFDVGLLDKREEFSSCPTLYLHFSGKIPEIDEKNFFSTIMNFAGEFKLLVECWAMAFEKELRDPKYLSHDPYEGAWLTGFTRKHGNRFQHELVHQYLGSLDYDQRLTGINKIYDTRYPFREVDLITPLLHQMQTDILEVMREESELVSLLFSEQNSDRNKRCLRTLFERYFGPKSLIGMPRNLFAEEEEKNDKNPTRRARILPSIITLINRGACEAEREAARHIYRHITGHDYPR
jgi:hypothetical protein